MHASATHRVAWLGNGARHVAIATITNARGACCKSAQLVAALTSSARPSAYLWRLRRLRRSSSPQRRQSHTPCRASAATLVSDLPSVSQAAWYASTSACTTVPCSSSTPVHGCACVMFCACSCACVRVCDRTTKEPYAPMVKAVGYPVRYSKGYSEYSHGYSEYPHDSEFHTGHAQRVACSTLRTHTGVL